MSEFYQTFKEKNTTNIYKLLYKIEVNTFIPFSDQTYIKI